MLTNNVTQIINYSEFFGLPYMFFLSFSHPFSNKRYIIKERPLTTNKTKRKYLKNSEKYKTSG